MVRITNLGGKQTKWKYFFLNNKCECFGSGYTQSTDPYLTDPLISPKAENFFDLFHVLFFFSRKIGGGLTDPPYFPENMLEGGESVDWV
jgi:hypothetical protein